MNSPAKPLRGVMSPVLTPFNADLSPSAPRFVKHCRWLLDQGVGLAIFGTNSEGNSLSVHEKRGLLDALLGAGLAADKKAPAPAPAPCRTRSSCRAMPCRRAAREC